MYWITKVVIIVVGVAIDDDEDDNDDVIRINIIHMDMSSQKKL